jgi:GNAT superfamily N-acetyltransferase
MPHTQQSHRAVDPGYITPPKPLVRSIMLQIRQGTPLDLEFVVRSNQALARETENLELDPARLRAGVSAILEAKVAGCYWIAEQEGKPVGQLALSYEWSDWRNGQVWWIQSVYVLAAARKDGIFRALYEHTRREAMKNGAVGIRLYVDVTNTRAQAVYGALGMNGGHYRVFEDMFAN